jgi:predicted transcriptional regulator
MKTREVIEKLGSNAAVARLLGITHGAVSQWGEEPPLLQQYRLRELRPDLFDSSEKALSGLR